MPALHVRQIPASVVEALKRRASKHHRSLQGELHAILDEAARAAPPPDGLAPLKLKQSSSRRTDPWTREELYDDRGR